MNTIAIIGTAGRGADLNRLTSDIFLRMYHTTQKIIEEIVPTKDVCDFKLVSGGAAWADHLAVTIFLAGTAPKLCLYLPCEFDMANCCFVDDGTIDWRTNPGGTANCYHKKFSDRIGKDTLGQIADAIDEGAEVIAGGGMFGRNALVAKNASHIIALTFGNKEILKDGGTANTMEAYIKYRAKEKLPDNSYHVDLNTMIVYKGAKV